MSSTFVNRSNELAVLDAWWHRPGAQLGIIWGRRRVGKSWLLSHWAKGRRAIFHVARNQSAEQELAALSRAAAEVVQPRRRNLVERPFVDWDDAFEVLAISAQRERLLLIIDEVPELFEADPRLPSTLRALWDGVQDSKLRLLLAGSAVRTMERMQQERAPLYGRAALRLLVAPFEPHEAALMLPHLAPAERARAWGVCGGVPYYLSLWDQSVDFATNLDRLVCSPQGPLLSEGDLVLATEDFAGGRRERLPEQVLRTITTGHTRFSEIKSALAADPTRALTALQELRLIERMTPVGAKPTGRLATYRIADNFLAFWLQVVERHRPSIERGLGPGVRDVMVEQFDDYMGYRWEDAFRSYVRRAFADDPRTKPLAELGSYWSARAAPGEDPVEIDAVGLTGRQRHVTLVGEAKWSRSADAGRLATALTRKLARTDLHAADNVVLVACARERLDRLPPDGSVVPVTAADIFG